MNDFRRQIVNRALWSAAGLIATCVVVMNLSIDGHFNVGDASYWGERANDFRLLLFGILVVVFIVSITKNVLAIRNPDRLDKMRIEEIDERNLFIKQKTGSIGMNVVIFGLTVATLITGKQNPEAFFAFLGSLLFVVAVRMFLVWYYRRRY